MLERPLVTKLRLFLALGLGAAACGSSSPSNPNVDAGAIPAGTAITGTLGTLGPAQPTVASFMISNSGETLLYFSSGPLTCQQVTVSRWLGGTQAGSQVVELVLPGAPTVGDHPVPPAEVNYAPGGMSSSHEVNADSGKITFTAVTPNASATGTFSAKYGSDMITGTFNATFCANGQGF